MTEIGLKEIKGFQSTPSKGSPPQELGWGSGGAWDILEAILRQI